MIAHVESGRVGVTVSITAVAQETKFSTRLIAEPGQATLAEDHLDTTTEIGGVHGAFESGYRVRRIGWTTTPSSI